MLPILAIQCLWNRFSPQSYSYAIFSSSKTELKIRLFFFTLNSKIVWILKTERIYPMKIISNYAFLMKALTVRIPYVSYGWRSNKGIKSRAIIVRYSIINEIQCVNYHCCNRPFKFRHWFITTCVYVLWDEKYFKFKIWIQ